MIAHLFLSKVATLTQAINLLPYMNFCLTAIEAAFAGISVFAGIVVFLAFNVQTSLLVNELSEPNWGGEWKTTTCHGCKYVICIYMSVIYVPHFHNSGVHRGFY